MITCNQTELLESIQLKCEELRNAERYESSTLLDRVEREIDQRQREGNIHNWGDHS